MVWVGNEKQEYSVKMGYNMLNLEDQMLSSEVFQILWNLKVVPSTIVCMWRILWDRLPTRVNLVRRGVQLENALCPMCREDIESVQHLFCTCKVAQKVWDLCDRWKGSVTVRHEYIPTHFQNFYLIGHKNSMYRVWKGLWVAIVTRFGFLGTKWCLEEGW